MHTFKIYPKEGEPFTLDIQRFEYKDGKLLVRNETTASYDLGGFLSMDNIAAVMPVKPLSYHSVSQHSPVTFKVYLKNRLEPLTITADTCDPSKPPALLFCTKGRAAENQIVDFPITGFYIALSEVVAVVPIMPAP